jgi:hypothetical protein
MHTLSRKHILVIGLAALVFVLIGAIVGLLVVSSGSGGSGSVRDLTLQPNDLPLEFVLTREKLFSREELLAGLPAESQVAETGLLEAINLTYASRKDDRVIINVFVYAYQDEASARAAHDDFSQKDSTPNYLVRRLNGGADPNAMTLSGGLAEELGDDGFAMSGEMEPEDGSSVPVSMYVMRSGSARAEVLVAGDSPSLDPEEVARNQYLRLQSPQAVAEP